VELSPHHHPPDKRTRFLSEKETNHKNKAVNPKSAKFAFRILWDTLWRYLHLDYISHFKIKCVMVSWNGRMVHCGQLHGFGVQAHSDLFLNMFIPTRPMNLLPVGLHFVIYLGRPIEWGPIISRWRIQLFLTLLAVLLQSDTFILLTAPTFPIWSFNVGCIQFRGQSVA
jgi:hypothetical protein